jgi:hypothetical protein
MRLLLGGLLFAFALSTARAAELPLIDAHIHYSQDAWDMLPPKAAIDVLRKAHLKKAMVSSSSDDGTLKLYAEAPDLIVPELRPYRSRGEIGTWFKDDTVIKHIEDRLAKFNYVGIGEFHIYGADADSPVMRRIVELAKANNLVLHAHSDIEAIERLFAQNPNARILWAHSGFAAPEKVREMLRKYKTLWADLAYRSEPGNGGKVDPAWREAFVEFPDRFMVGTDTFTPERWYYIEEHAKWARAWLADLPPDLAERIAYRNFEALYAGMKIGPK